MAWYPCDPRRESPRRWLGIAAASALLAGGALLALTKRSAHDPVTAPDSTTTTVARPTTTAAAESTAPWFRIDAPGLVGGDVVTSPAMPPAEQDLFQSWTYDDGDAIGYITALIRSSPVDSAADSETLDVLEVDDGTAHLVVPNDSEDPNFDHWLQVRWFRSDGSLWMFRGQGMDRSTFAALVTSAVPGSGLPIVVPAPNVTPWTVGVVGAETTSQRYGTGTAIVDLSIQRDGSAFQNLIGAANVDEVTVAGLPGFAALTDDDSVEVTWDAGDGWWGRLSISPELARDADGIIAAVVAAPLEK